MKLQLLFISPRYSGGIGGHAARVADKLQKQLGYEIDLMHVPHVPVKKLKNPSFALFGMLKSILGKKHYDIVHAFNVPSAFAMKYAKAKKKVLSVHGVYSEQVGSIHSSALSSLVSSNEIKILKWADKLTTNSLDVQKAYKEKYGVDFEYLLGPIDTEKFKSIPNNVQKKQRQVVYIGRDSREKGIDVLKQAEELINGNVVYCTNVPWTEAMKTLKESSVLAVPSRMESIPNVIKEAFYLKVPVVGTKVGAIPEMITDYKNGILVPPEDAEKLAKAVNYILDNPESAQQLLKNGYDFVINNMTWDVLLPRYQNFYEKLLKE